IAVCLLGGCIAEGDVGFSQIAIVNGTPANHDPEVVALLRETKTWLGESRPGSFECTGTVIAPHVVLSAAHCASDIAWVRLDDGTTIPIADTRVRPDFDPTWLTHDSWRRSWPSLFPRKYRTQH